MNPRKTILFPVILILFLFGCATHELVLSKKLRPVLSDLDFNMTLFRARVDKGVLEVWGRIKRDDSDYKNNFDIEIDSAAVLCKTIAWDDLVFKYDWHMMEVQLTNEYGSQWRWKNTVSHTRVRLNRETLLEIKSLNIPISEYPKRWTMIASKTGPPDYVPLEWAATVVK